MACASKCLPHSICIWENNWFPTSSLQLLASNTKAEGGKAWQRG